MVDTRPRGTHLLDTEGVIALGDRLTAVTAMGHPGALVPEREDPLVALTGLGELAALGTQVGGDRRVQLFHGVPTLSF
jgi:hypothetical protein